MKKRKIQKFKFRPFSKKQLKVINWWRPETPTSKYDIMIADGSVRSGKTVACILGFLLFTLEFQNENFIVAGKTIGAVKRNVVAPMLAMLISMGIEYEYNRSENFIVVGTNTYYLFAGNNESSQDTVQGLTAAGAYLDEVALMPKSFVYQVLSRCSVEGAKIFMNCNPDRPSHYINQEFILIAPVKNVYHIHFTMDDNLTLSASRKEYYKKSFTGVFYKRMIQGLWCAADGLVYEEFANNKEKFIITDADLNEPDLKKRRFFIRTAFIGVDFGGTGSATTFTLTGITEKYDVVVLDEFYRKERMSPTELCAAFVDFVKRAQEKYRVYEARCDSAEQTLIQGLIDAVLRAGVVIDVRNAIKGPINDRIAFYNSIIAQGRFFIHEKCKKTIEALEEAVYDEKKGPLKDERLDDGTTNIDSLDSMEYSTEPLHPDLMYLAA